MEKREWIQKNKRKWITLGIGLTLLVLGVVLTAVTRPGAIAEGATAAAKIPFALGLILILMGILVPLAGVIP